MKARTLSFVWIRASRHMLSALRMVPPFVVQALSAYSATRDPSGAREASNGSWIQYVRSPSSNTVRPVSIVPGSVTGNVSNPGALLEAEANRVTVLSRLSTDDAVACLTVDFGQNHAGQLHINFAGSQKAPGSHTTAGHGYPSLQLAFSETLQYLTNRSDFTRSDNAYDDTPGLVVQDGVDQIAVKPSPYTWIDQQGCEHGDKVCSDGLHGFRYVKLCLNDTPVDVPYSSAPYTSPLGEVSIGSVTLDYSGYLGTPDTFTGFFECSDAQLTQWWYDGVYTADLCTDVFRVNDTEPRYAASPSLLGKVVLHDGPKRDRDPYVGDLAVSALTSYLSHDVPEAAENVLADLADHQSTAVGTGWIPPASIRNYTLPLFDYPLWWIHCVHDLVYYTGKTDFLNGYFHTVVLTLDTFYPQHTDAKTSLLLQDPNFGDYGFLPRNGSVTYFNALYVLALQRAADLADSLSQDAQATAWRQRAETVARSLLERNWDAGVGAFFDGTACAGGAPCPTHAQDGNSLAILAGVTAGRNGSAASILDFLSRATARPWGNAFFSNDVLGPAFSQRVYPFLSYFELVARFATSRATAPSAFEELRRLYGWMSARGPRVTFWEGIGPAGVPYEGGFTSMAHGWGTGVTPLLTGYVLGVRPTAPGFGAWAVKPVVDGSGLGWARGQVLTPRGPIAVAWEAGSGDAGFRIRVDAPPGTNGSVSVPVDGAGDSVTLDGASVYRAGSGATSQGPATAADGYVTVMCGGGTHILQVVS